MAEFERRNLSYLGTVEGTIDTSGQLYDRVSANGELSVRGTLYCNELSINGNFSDEGTLKAKKGKINGDARIKGVLESDHFKVNGKLEVGGTALVKELHTRGNTIVGDCIVAEKIDLLGDIRVKNDCNAETFVSRGAFDIGGLLNASDIDIRLFDECRVKEIGGETIKIHRVHRSLFDRVLRFILPGHAFGGNLVTETIEGDEVYVEYTTAKTVRGKNVKIGPGCDIELVDYRDSFEQDKSSKIKKNVKTGN